MASRIALVGFLCFFAFLSVLSAYDLTKGNWELKLAFDEAQIRLSEDGVWSELIGIQYGAFQPYMCGWKRNDFPLRSSINPDGALANVLDTRVLKAVFLANINFEYSHINGSLYFGLVTPDLDLNAAPTGTWAEWLIRCVEQISLAYNVPIEIQYSYWDGSAETLSALMRGDAHMAMGPFSDSGYYADQHRYRNFIVGCPACGSDVSELYKLGTDGRWDDKDSFLSDYNVQPTDTFSIGVQGTGTCFAYETIYNRAKIVCSNDNDELNDWLNSGVVDLISSQTADSVRLAGTPTAAGMTGHLFRFDYTSVREECVYDLSSASSSFVSVVVFVFVLVKVFLVL